MPTNPLPPPTTQPPLQPIRTREKRDAISAALEAYRIETSAAWPALAKLSPSTRFDEIALVPGGVFERGSGPHFEAAATLYVDLKDVETNEMISTYFPATVAGHFVSGGSDTLAAEIDSVTIDSSSLGDGDDEDDAS